MGLRSFDEYAAGVRDGREVWVDADYAVSFAIPLATPGLRMIAEASSRAAGPTTWRRVSDTPASPQVSASVSNSPDVATR